MTSITASDIRRARKQEYGETIKIDRHGQVFVPQNFEKSNFPKSLPLGAETVYREDTPTDSVQIRVHENKVTLQLDEYNPEYHPVKHALSDATKYTAAVAVGIAAIYFSG